MWLIVTNFLERRLGEVRRIPLPRTSVYRDERKDSGFDTRAGPNRRTRPFSSATLLDSLLSCGLADPFAGPFDLLTPPCDVVPRVSFDPIRTRATGDVVLAPIYSAD